MWTTAGCAHVTDAQSLKRRGVKKPGGATPPGGRWRDESQWHAVGLGKARPSSREVRSDGGKWAASGEVKWSDDGGMGGRRGSFEAVLPWWSGGHAGWVILAAGEWWVLLQIVFNRGDVTQTDEVSVKVLHRSSAVKSSINQSFQHTRINTEIHVCLNLAGGNSISCVFFKPATYLWATLSKEVKTNKIYSAFWLCFFASLDVVSGALLPVWR